MPDKSPIEVNVQQLVYAVVNAAMGNGLAPEGEVDFARSSATRPLIVVAAAPKSGSTFLANTLSKLTGLRGFRLCAAYATNEHDLYLPALCLMNRYGCVSQLHMKGTFHNAALMRVFGIKPIILVRRIDDIVVSLMQDMKRKQQSSTLGTGQQGYSFIWQNQGVKNLSDERLLDMIIDLAVPWFVNFYVSWRDLCNQRAVEALWVTYEEMFADKESTLRKILDFVGFPDFGTIDPTVLAHEYHTFRSGTVGSGAAVLTSEQRRRIRDLFSYYPEVDFATYGL